MKDLKIGKSASLDNLQSGHFKYADQLLRYLRCMVFNAMFTHGYVPYKRIETIIVLIITISVPIIKDKKGLVTDMDSYHPIATLFYQCTCSVKNC